VGKIGHGNAHVRVPEVDPDRDARAAVERDARGRPTTARARAGDDRLPVTRAVAAVRAAGGSVTWLLDRAAAD
jgi:hypothetical protein